MTIRAMQNGFAPAFIQSGNVGQGIAHTGCQNDAVRFDQTAIGQCYVKQPVGCVRHRACCGLGHHRCAKIDSVITTQLINRGRADFARRFAIMTEKTVRRGGKPVARFAAINDANGAARPGKLQCGG